MDLEAFITWFIETQVPLIEAAGFEEADLGLDSPIPVPAKPIGPAPSAFVREFEDF